MATTRQINMRVEFKLGTYNAYLQAFKSINKELDASYARVAKLRALVQVPDLHKEKILLDTKAEEAMLQLAIERKKIMERIGALVQPAVTADEKRRAALRSINEELEGQEKRLTRINALLNEPGKLRQTVQKQLQVEDAEKKLTFEHSKERARQQGPLKALGDLFGLGGGTSKFLQTKGGTLAGIGEGMGGKLGGLLKGAGGGLAAAAGPVGLAISAAMALGPVVKKLAAAPYQPIVKGMTALNTALKALEGPLGPTGAVLGGIKNYFKTLETFAKGPFGNSMLGGSVVLEQFAKAMGKVTEQVGEFLTTAVSLAAKAQPGVAKRFGLALDDTAAVIGHRMVPIVELLTKVTRGIGDVLHTVLPSTQDMRAALAPLGEAFDDIKQAMADVAPLIKDALLVGLKLFGEFLKLIAKGVRGLVNLAKSFGLLSGTGKLQSSMGLAARPAHFTSPEEYAKSIYQAAFSQGYDPQKTTADNTSKIVDLLGGIKDAITGIPEKIGGFFKEVTVAIAGIAVEVGKAVLEAGQKLLALVKDALPDMANLATGGLGSVLENLSNVAVGSNMATDQKDFFSRAQESLTGYGGDVTGHATQFARSMLGGLFGGETSEVNPNEQAAGGGDAQMARNNQLLERIAAGLMAGANAATAGAAGAARQTWLGLFGG